MKYRDIITVFTIIFFILSAAYSAGVSNSVWFWLIPAALFVFLIVVIYKLWL